MRFSWVDNGVTTQGVTERGFAVERAERRVPGVVWTPENAQGPRPLVLLGHGGSGHKRMEYVVAVARWLVRRHGFSAAAIDGPVHGDRRTDGRNDTEAVNRDLRRMWAEDPTMTDEMVADWRATLDALSDPSVLGTGPVGWWGISMGTILGLPLVAAEPRISVAVLGLMGLTGPTKDRLRADAAAVQCPVLFLVQWNDELFKREKAFDLFDALGTADKRLHANPGTHIQVPIEEFRTSVAFLAAALGDGS